MDRSRRAFTLIELLVVVAIIALLIGILLPALGEARRASKMALCISNLKQLGVASQSYAGEHADRIANYSWQPGKTYSQWPDLNASKNSMEAAASQFLDIIRRAGREDISTSSYVGAWFPHMRWTHVVLLDHIGGSFPSPIVSCPEDVVLKAWASNPFDFDKGLIHPAPDPPPGTNWCKKWPYASSYQTTIFAYDFFQSVLSTNPTVLNRRLYLGSTQNALFVPANSRLGGTRLSDVLYPAQKASMYDSHQRHFGRLPVFFGNSLSSQPILHFDASVVVRSHRDEVRPGHEFGNDGWDPRNPASSDGTLYDYQPAPWEPPPSHPTTPGAGKEPARGYLLLTRGGLRGLDFSGSEIDTGQPK